jgi:hypothetical protein
MPGSKVPKIHEPNRKLPSIVRRIVTLATMGSAVFLATVPAARTADAAIAGHWPRPCPQRCRHNPDGETYCWYVCRGSAAGGLTADRTTRQPHGGESPRKR